MNSEKNNISRRGFLKTAAAMGAALAIQPTLEKVEAANNIIEGNNSSPHTPHSSLNRRTLGSGKAAFTVSALGFGCMELNYNRSQSPSRKQCIRIIHEAVDRGVTLFDTAIDIMPSSSDKCNRRLSVNMVEFPLIRVAEEHL